MSKDTGGYVFPFKDHEEGMFGQCNGMTMRDYFAAKAMAAYSSDPDWRADMAPSDTAYAAYAMADAMLKARDA